MSYAFLLAFDSLFLVIPVRGLAVSIRFHRTLRNGRWRRNDKARDHDADEFFETMKPMVDAERALLAMANPRVWEDDASRPDLWNRLRESQGQMRKVQVDMQQAVEKLATSSGVR